MLDHGKLREVVDNIKDKKDNRRVNFATKHSAARIYGKIGRTECQLVIDTGAKVSVCTKPMADLLKLKPKSDKTMTVVAIDGIKQKLLRSAGLVTVKVMDQLTQVEMQIVQSKDQVVILAMDWIQKYKAVIDMNEERITFRVDGRKFTTKLVPDVKPQNKVHYYTMSESEDIIDLTITDDDVTKAMDRDDESCPIMIDSEEKSTSSDEDTTLIPNQLKGKFLDDAIASYKAKCRQYIEQRKAERLATYLKQQAKDIVERSLGHQVKELPEDETNPALYLTYLGGDSMFKWMETDKYNQEAKLYELIGEEVIDTHVKEMLDEILNEYDDVVSKGSHDIGNCTQVKHDIRLNDERPIKRKQSPKSAKENEWIKGQIDEILKNGVIEPSTSPYVFNIVIVGKKDGAGKGMDRMCINYAPLNEVTEKDSGPIPIIKEYLALFHGVKWLTVLDLASAYWQILLTKRSRKYIAFITAYELYQFKVMPFGLVNVPATFQRFMNDVLRDYLRKFCLIYLDDIIIYSKSLKDHKRHVRKVLQAIRSAGLKLKPAKCKWFKQEITFLGHKIGVNGIKPDDYNLKKIREAQPPQNERQLRGFLGLAQYYRNFIKWFSTFARPLFRLLKKNIQFEWTISQQTAFDILKQKLTEEPILAHPDFTKMFKLYTDASDVGLEAVLMQEDDQGKDRVICYEAKTLLPAEKNYPIIEKECLAVMWAMQKFKHFLGGGQPFEIYTDHAVLKTLMTHENPSSRRAQWIEKLALFNFTIHYQPGVKMGHADFASRMDTFLPKDSTSASTSTLRALKQPELLSPKRRITPMLKPFNLTNNKKQKSNPMAPPRKVEIIRRKKTHNGHYYQQCRIYYQGYRHKCLTPQPKPQPKPQPQPQPSYPHHK